MTKLDYNKAKLYYDTVLMSRMDTPKAIKPTPLETSLYVAALEVASRRGYPASEVRVFSPLPQFVDGGRWFDGSAWFFTWRHALIEAIQEEARLYPLDLLAWREQPPPEEGVELLAVLAAREHKWRDWSTHPANLWYTCDKCLSTREHQLKYTSSPAYCYHELIQCRECTI